MQELRRSWVGTVSSVLGFVAAEAAIAVPLLALLEASLGRGADSAAVVAPLVLSAVMAAVALILGITVLVRKGRSRGSAILGLAFSAVAVFLLCFFVVRLW
jgi:hypothetical protein